MTVASLVRDGRSEVAVTAREKLRSSKLALFCDGLGGQGFSMVRQKRCSE